MTGASVQDPNRCPFDRAEESASPGCMVERGGECVQIRSHLDYRLLSLMCLLGESGDCFTSGLKLALGNLES